MHELGYRFFASDNHYYEPDDCCTRHLSSKFEDRSVHMREEADGARVWYFSMAIPLTRFGLSAYPRYVANHSIKSLSFSTEV